MISQDNIWLLWSIIILIATFSIYLESNYKVAAKISGAIIALIIALTLSNFNIIPIESVVYDTVWSYIVPISIPLLLFQCDLVQIYKKSGRLLIIFLISSIGTMLGAFLAFYLLKDKIEQLNSVAAMMTASYIGGGVNFVAVSTTLNVDPKLVSAVIVSDNMLMAVYFLVLITIPSIKFVSNFFKRDDFSNQQSYTKKVKTVGLIDIALSITIAFIIVTISFAISDTFKNSTNDIVKLFTNKYLLLTSISVLLSTVFSKVFKKLTVAQDLGTFMIYIFFVVIGIPASIMSIVKNSPLLLVFCFIILVVNLIVTLIFAKLCNFTLEEALLASNANIGGPTTAMAMAISKSWDKYAAPVMLVGTLGYIIGNYLGLIIFRILS